MPVLLRKILFVVNPISGKRKYQGTIVAIKEHFPMAIPYEIIIWKEKNSFDEIVWAIKTGNYSDVVAVGGDGTVNSIAKVIAGSDISLGIIPGGSGNGLARSLGLSMNTVEAIKQIAAGKKTKIDYGIVNEIPFICTSGVGFDAHIGNLFAKATKRGLAGYIKIISREIFSYKPEEYTLKFNNTEIKRNAFLITVANAGQYGNDFFIAPEAKMTDGLFHMVVIKPLNFFELFGLLIKILQKKAHLSNCIETYTANKIVISRQKAAPVHFDGEPVILETKLEFQIKAHGLTVIVGEKFR